jgi:glycosyltransferase involved in cell wall biosynthesis
MKLSILIPTHKRPELFKRCLKSARLLLDNNDVEIIVNNDSNDIIPEYYHPNITYYFNKFDNLSKVYQFLLSKASGEYVYYLEDDDYLVKNFDVPLVADIIAGNYCPTYDTVDKLTFMRLFNDKLMSPEEFTESIYATLEHLQLSQFIFKRDTIKNFVFPMDNNVHNDINLVMYATSNAKQILTLNKVFFYQTVDGGDNISFEGTTKELNTIASMDFLKEYQ